MTAALQYPPEALLTSPRVARALHQRPGSARAATVTILHPPVDIAADVPLRLTRRGLAVVLTLVAVLGSALILVAVRSAMPVAAAASSATPSAVTVQVGDTLWSIASRVAPGRDPRAEVAALQRRNHLPNVDLQPGQVLRVP